MKYPTIIFDKKKLIDIKFEEDLDADGRTCKICGIRNNGSGGLVCPNPVGCPKRNEGRHEET